MVAFKDYILIREKETLIAKIEQSKIERSKLYHIIQENKIQGLNNLIRRLFFTKQTLYLKDLFYIYRERNRQEQNLKFFSKVLKKFKKLRIAGKFFEQLKIKMDQKQKSLVVKQRREHQLKINLLSLFNYNRWFMKQRRVKIKNLLKSVIHPFVSQKKKVFMQIQAFINPQFRSVRIIELEKLNRGVYEVQFLISRAQQKYQAIFFSNMQRIFEKNANKFKRAYPMLSLLSNKIQRTKLDAIKEIKYYTKLRNLVESQNVYIFLNIHHLIL